MHKSFRSLAAIAASVFSVATAAVFAFGTITTTATAAGNSAATPAAGNGADKATYIITINPSGRTGVEKQITNNGWAIKQKYQYALDGFAVEIPRSAANALAKTPNVLSIEEEVAVKADVDPTTQSPVPSWGLDRVDQRTKIGTTSAYIYGSAGAGATIYVVDTGIYPHNDLAGRISSVGYTAISDGNGTVDCNGHGTHVSATTAGTKYGIAKSARLVPVRVLGCTGSGSTSGVIAGLDWILSPSNTNPKTQAVVNMSLGGAFSSTLNNAIAKLTNAGVNVIVAAGNNGADACSYSPASAPSAVTVGATTNTDATASYSNQGSCVDIFGPGSSITSAWYTGVDATNTISGTSMATPHVAGVAAVYVGANPGATVAQVSAFLDAQSTLNAISGVKALTVNKLLYIEPGYGSGLASPSPSPSPTATSTASPSPSPTATATASPSPSPTATATASPSPSPTATKPGKKRQTLTFPALANREFGAAAPLLASSTSGLAVTYKSLTPKVCYVLYPSSGAAVQTVTPTPTGDLTCIIEASQPGNADYDPADTITRSFKWLRAPMYITPYAANSDKRNSVLSLPNAPTYAVGQTYNFVTSLLYLSGQNSGLASIGHLLKAESLTPTVCTVLQVAIQDRGSLFTWASIKMLQKSTCTIRWSFDGTATRDAASRDMSVLVTK